MPCPLARAVLQAIYEPLGWKDDEKRKQLQHRRSQFLLLWPAGQHLPQAAAEPGQGQLKEQQQPLEGQQQCTPAAFVNFRMEQGYENDPVLCVPL
jgi:hypothetical protein